MMTEKEFTRSLTEICGCDAIYRNVTGSTNTDAKEAALMGAPEGSLFCAGAQTAGRGRLGRSFYSPDSGFYISILMRPEPELPGLVTAASACAVAQTIDEVFGRHSMIKWVNDIYLDGLKVSGILCESVFRGAVPICSVVGIGINLSTPEGGFPAELAGKAGSVLGGSKADDAQKLALAAGIHARLTGFRSRLTEREFMPFYRERSLLTGRTVCYTENDSEHTAEAVGIDDRAGLIVDENGSRRTLTAGEVTIGHI